MGIRRKLSQPAAVVSADGQYFEWAKDAADAARKAAAYEQKTGKKVRIETDGLAALTRVADADRLVAALRAEKQPLASDDARPEAAITHSETARGSASICET